MKQKIKKIMRKTGVKQLFLLLLLSGIVFACVNDNEPFSDSGRQNGNRGRQPLSPEVIAAQAWFENEVPRGFLAWYTEETPKEERRILMPNWRRTLSNADSIWRVTEARIQSNRNLLRVSAESSKKFKQTNNPRYLASDTRFVLRTHIETGQTVGFIMKVSPDLSYIQSRSRRNNNPLGDFTYLKRDKDFRGFIYFYDLEGEFVNGWRQIDGRFYAIFPAYAVERQPQLRSGLCGLHCVELWQKTRIYLGEEFVGERSTFIREICTYFNCFPGNPPPGDDDPWTPIPDPDLPPGHFWPPQQPLPQLPPEDDDNQPSPPSLPQVCRDGRASRNNWTFDQPAIKGQVDNVLRQKTEHHHEWSISIGRGVANDEVHWYVNMVEGGPLSGYIPPNLGGFFVATAHSHPKNSAGFFSPGVPSAGDVFTFLDLVQRCHYMESMYVFGRDWFGNIEVYAINVHNRARAIQFLENNPREQAFCRLRNRFEGDVGYAFDDAVYQFSRPSRGHITDADSDSNPYFYRGEAVALAHIMNYFNMGITLSRRVNDGRFHTINTQREGDRFEVNLCP